MSFVARRKLPLEKRVLHGDVADPAVYVPGFLAYLDAECGLAANTLAAYRRDLDRFVAWNRDAVKASVHQVAVAVLTQFLE